MDQDIQILEIKTALQSVLFAKSIISFLVLFQEALKV